MGFIFDMLKEVPLSAVLKEKLTVAEAEVKKLTDRISSLEAENSQLHSRLSAATKIEQGDLAKDTLRLLKCMFKESAAHGVTVASLVHYLGFERGMVLYHLDELREQKFVQQISIAGMGRDAAWALTPAGRKFAVTSISD